jgi:hypothetical protein
VYEALEYNGRSMPDLLILGGSIAVPGLPTLAADVLVNYERPLLKRAGVIADIGDLGGVQAQDTLHVDGLHLVPMPEALEDGALNVGAPAHFLVTEDAQGRRTRFVFEGALPNRR